MGGDPHAADAACAAVERWASRAPRVLDVDERIALGEGELARLDDDAWERRTVRFHLASILHRRACLRTDLARGIADATRAVEIDAHPEYLTTLALLFERMQDDHAARETHDRAVVAIDTVAPGPEDGQTRYAIGARDREIDRDIDYRDSFPRRAARTLECRGAFRAKHGDRDGAIADLRASLAMHETESAGRRLARLGA